MRGVGQKCPGSGVGGQGERASGGEVHGACGLSGDLSDHAQRAVEVFLILDDDPLLIPLVLDHRGRGWGFVGEVGRMEEQEDHSKKVGVRQQASTTLCQTALDDTPLAV